jgi:hypothetical protein
MKAFFISYVLRSSEKKDQDLCKLYGRITACGVRLDFSLNRRVKLSAWDEHARRPKGRSEAERELSKFLSTTEELFYKIERKLIQDSIPVTAANLLKYYNEAKSDVPVENTKTLFTIFELHNKQLKELHLQGNVVRPTITRYTTYLDNSIQLKRKPWRAKNVLIRGGDLDSFLKIFFVFYRFVDKIY